MTSFSTLSKLGLHKRNKHILLKEFQCYKCPKAYNFKNNYQLHLDTHISQTFANADHVCQHCGKSFHRTTSFRGHLQSHQFEDMFECVRCGKRFEFRTAFEVHLKNVHRSGADGAIEEILAEAERKTRLHSKSYKTTLSTSRVKKYECQTCNKVFQKPCLLWRHEAGHLSVKPFQCRKCDQSFTQKPSLERHQLQKHQGEKLFSCPKCKLKVAQKANLITHIKRTHPLDANLETMFPCNHCACLFTKLNSLSRHKAMMHRSEGGQLFPDTANCDDDAEDDPIRTMRNVMDQLKFIQFKMQAKEIKEKLPEKVTEPVEVKELRKTITLVDTLNPSKEKTFKTAYQIIRSDGSRYIACKFCAKEFQRPYDLLRHLRIHTHERPFKCEYCEKAFSTKTTLGMHTKVHATKNNGTVINRIHPCTICEKRFDSIRQLDTHTRTHDKPSMLYVCQTCSRTFSSKSAFSSHKHNYEDKEFEALRSFLLPPIKIDDGNCAADEDYSKRMHQCSVCGFKMKKRSHLIQHERTHSGLKPFKCATCERLFTTKSSLNLHHKIHLAHKPYACEKCPHAKFSTNAQLVRHKIVHSLKRNFLCPYCDAPFKTSDTCKNHMLTHIRGLLGNNEITSQQKDAKPAENKVQAEINSLKNVLTLEDQNNFSPSYNSTETNDKQHTHLSPKFIELEMIPNCQKHNHRNITIESIPVTSISTESQSNMVAESECSQESEQIVTIEASNPSISAHNCSICKKIFQKPSDLQRHMRTHTKERPFACDLCAKTFALQSTLKHHRKTHDTTRQTFECQVCGKRYASNKALVVHLRIHTGERPFSCELCGNAFRTSGHRIAHIKAKHK